MTPIHHPVSAIVYSALGHEVSTVMIDGRFVMRDGVVTGVNEAAVRRQAQISADDLARRVRLRPLQEAPVALDDDLAGRGFCDSTGSSRFFLPSFCAPVERESLDYRARLLRQTGEPCSGHLVVSPLRSSGRIGPKSGHATFWLRLASAPRCGRSPL